MGAAPAAMGAAPAAEGAGVTLAAGPPRRKLACGGARLRQGLAAAGLSLGVGRVEAAEMADRGAPAGMAVWGVAPDEALLLCEAGATDIHATLRGAGAAVSDVSAGLVELRLAGPRVRALLEELCTADLSEGACPAGSVVQAPMAGVRVILARLDGADGAPGFTLLVSRDVAEYLWGVLVASGARHRLAAAPPSWSPDEGPRT
jgi:heterotetrameric sarcosine oxidase gamma subunit